MKITDGPYKGYYTINLDQSHSSTFGSYLEMQKSLQQASGGRGLAWYKYSPGPGKDIEGFNQTYLPKINGFYYVPLDQTIDIRRQLYALENKLIPADGNTERFNLELSKVHVPDDWCPYFIDPMPTSCIGRKKKVYWINEVPEGFFSKLLRGFLWFIFALFIGLSLSYLVVYA